MKKILLAILLVCLLCSTAWADVTAEVIKTDVDTNGNIRVCTQYKIDGVEVISRYPQVDGKYIFVTRYNTVNFAGMTKLEAKQHIGKDIIAFAKNLTQRKFLEIDNADAVQNFLDGLVGQSVTVTEASILVDTDKDGVPDKEWVVKTDGTKVENEYTP